MSWKLILKSSGCGCNDCNSITKSPKGISGGPLKIRKKTRYGTTS